MKTATAQQNRAIRAQDNLRWPWDQHPGWSEYNARRTSEPLRMPPPPRTKEEIRALIVGRASSSAPYGPATTTGREPSDLRGSVA